MKGFITMTISVPADEMDELKTEIRDRQKLYGININDFYHWALEHKDEFLREYPI